MCPGRRILWFVAVSNANEVTPYFHASTEVVEVLGNNQVLVGIGIHHPPVIEGRYSLAVIELYMGEVGVDEG